MFMMNTEPGPIVEVNSQGTYVTAEVTMYDGGPWNKAQKLADNYVRELFGNDYAVLYLKKSARGLRCKRYYFQIVLIGPGFVNVPYGKFYSDDTRKDSI